MAKNLEVTAKLLLETLPRAMRLIRAEMRAASGATGGSTGLTIPQFRILIHTAHAQSSNRALAEWMGVSEPTMSKMVGKLVRRGLLSRVATSGDDRRQVQVRCTAKGLRMAEAMRAIARTSLAKRLAARPKATLRELSVGLKALADFSDGGMG